MSVMSDTTEVEAQKRASGWLALTTRAETAEAAVCRLTAEVERLKAAVEYRDDVLDETVSDAEVQDIAGLLLSYTGARYERGAASISKLHELAKVQAATIADLRENQELQASAWLKACDDLSEKCAEHAAVRGALERARGCIKGLLAKTPVRDVAETLAEIDAALTGGEP